MLRMTRIPIFFRVTLVLVLPAVLLACEIGTQPTENGALTPTVEEPVGAATEEGLPTATGLPGDATATPASRSMSGPSASTAAKRLTPEEKEQWALDSLDVIQRADPSLAQALSGLPWLSDGFTGDEARALDVIRHFAETDLKTANSVVNVLQLSGAVEEIHADALGSLDYILRKDRVRGESLVNQSWFQDGLTDQETALIVVLRDVVEENQEVFDDLIQGGRVRSETLSLSSGDVDLFLIRRPSLEYVDESVFDDLGAAVKAIEEFMGPPWVKSDVILLVELDIDLFSPEGGSNYGTHMSIVVPEPGAPAPRQAIYHEPAHYYFRLDIFPEWLAEGASDFLFYSVVGRNLQALYASVQKDVAFYCEWVTPNQDVNTVQELLDYVPPAISLGVEFGVGFEVCPYRMGSSFLLAMDNALGREVVSSSLRELYRLGEAKGSPVTEDEIYQAFLDNTPAAKQSEFRDLYYFHHGGPASDHIPVGPPPSGSVHYGRPIPGYEPTGPAALASDREALAAIYNAAGGPNWNNSENWLSDAPLYQWHGATSQYWDENTADEDVVPAGDYRVYGLQLHGNGLSGPVPPELGLLWWLEELYLSDNRLTGPIPPELGNLHTLSRLSMSGNQLSGPIPPELGNLGLTELGLSFNRLSGEIPPELGRLRGLRVLALSDNELTGPIPPELGALGNLRFLDLSRNRLSGDIPPELGNLTNLQNLRLSGNRLTGCIPASLRSQLSPASILGDLPFCGTAPSVTSDGADRAALVALYNATNGPNWANNDNWLTDAPLSEWHGVTTDDDGRVVDLTLSENRLSGEMPRELGNLDKLRKLWLPRNRLTGEIPRELGKLSGLLFLELSSNQLNGEIPPELGNLTRLNVLSLSINNLSGEIPPELGGISNLRQLQLNRNELSGELPSELGGLTKLKWLVISDNQLTGCIPRSLENSLELIDTDRLQFC